MLINQGRVAIFFAVMVYDTVARNNYVLVLTEKLLSAVESLPVKLIADFTALIRVTNLRI